MPTEAELEYALRGGTTTARWWGNDADQACAYANVADRTAKSLLGTKDWAIHNCNDGHAYTAPVGSFKANGFGLFDAIGNAWVWAEDCWHDGYSGAPADGSACTRGGDCGKRVLRGGSWDDTPRVARSARRNRDDVAARDGEFGFRLVRTLP